MIPFVKFPLFTKYMFYNDLQKVGHVFRFSSELEKVGIEWDVSLENGAGVDIISEPIEIVRPQYGTIAVIKVRADVATDYHTIIKEFWVPAASVFEVKKNETESPQLRN